MVENNRLPRSFYKEVVDEIDPRLKEFYEIHKSLKYFEEEFFDICAGILSSAVYDKASFTDQQSLVKFFAEKRKQWERKKKRWYESLLINCEQIPMTASNYPFSDIVLFRKKADRSRWEALYGNHNLDEVIKEELSRAEEWAADKSSYFIDFPALESMTVKQIFTAFESDVLSCEYNILKSKYKNLDLSEFMLSYVDEMGGAYFTDRGKVYRRNSPDEGYSGEIPISEDGSAKLLVTVSKEAFGENTELTSLLDDKDQRILLEIMKRASADVGSSDKPIMIEVGELAKVVTKSSRPGKRAYIEAERRVYKIVNVTFSIIRNPDTGQTEAKTMSDSDDFHGEQIGAVNFLSAAVADVRDGKKYMRIYLGSTISEAIENNRVRRLPSASYDALTNRKAKIMLLSLQRERIKANVLYSDGKIPDCATTFRYSDFLAMVNLGSSNKRKNMTEIKAALADMKNNKVVVDSFHVDTITNVVQIWWVPLTEEEMKDLSWFGYDEDIVEMH